VAELRKCIDLDPNYWPAYYFLGQAYQQVGRFADAIAVLQKAREIEDQIAVPLAELAHAYVMAGRWAEAHQALNELLARSSSGHVSKYVIATVYAALGEKDQAFAMLERAYEERSWYLVFLRLDPELDSLRSDMRFQDLLRRMNFPPLPRG
jgi:tetratricopeptide (TPR) repeat protein